MVWEKSISLAKKCSLSDFSVGDDELMMMFVDDDSCWWSVCWSCFTFFPTENACGQRYCFLLSLFTLALLVFLFPRFSVTIKSYLGWRWNENLYQTQENPLSFVVSYSRIKHPNQIQIILHKTTYSLQPLFFSSRKTFWVKIPLKQMNVEEKEETIRAENRWRWREKVLYSKAGKSTTPRNWKEISIFLLPSKHDAHACLSCLHLRWMIFPFCLLGCYFGSSLILHCVFFSHWNRKRLNRDRQLLPSSPLIPDSL